MTYVADCAPIKARRACVRMCPLICTSVLPCWCLTQPGSNKQSNGKSMARVVICRGSKAGSQGPGDAAAPDWASSSAAGVLRSAGGRLCFPGQVQTPAQPVQQVCRLLLPCDLWQGANMQHGPVCASLHAACMATRQCQLTMRGIWAPGQPCICYCHISAFAVLQWCSVNIRAQQLNSSVHLDGGNNHSTIQHNCLCCPYHGQLHKDFLLA